jgi:hypothetical protein
MFYLLVILHFAQQNLPSPLMLAITFQNLIAAFFPLTRESGDQEF